MEFYYAIRNYIESVLGRNDVCLEDTPQMGVELDVQKEALKIVNGKYRMGLPLSKANRNKFFGRKADLFSDELAWVLLVGGLYHELGHIISGEPVHVAPLKSTLSNIVSDANNHNIIPNEWFGATKYINAVYEMLGRPDFEEALADTLKMKLTVLLDMLNQYRTNLDIIYNGKEVQSLPDDHDLHDIFEELKPLMERARTEWSTNPRVLCKYRNAIIDEFYAKLKDWYDEQVPPPQQESSGEEDADQQDGGDGDNSEDEPQESGNGGGDIDDDESRTEGDSGSDDDDDSSEDEDGEADDQTDSNSDGTDDGADDGAEPEESGSGGGGGMPDPDGTDSGGSGGTSGETSGESTELGNPAEDGDPSKSLEEWYDENSGEGKSNTTGTGSLAEELQDALNNMSAEKLEELEKMLASTAGDKIQDELDGAVTGGNYDRAREIEEEEQENIATMEKFDDRNQLEKIEYFQSSDDEPSHGESGHTPQVPTGIKATPDASVVYHLRNVFKRMTFGRTYKGRKVDITGRKLHSPNFYQVKTTKEPMIMKDVGRVKIDESKTDVVMMFDRSYSMDGPESIFARKVMATFYTALKPIKDMRLQMFGFDNYVVRIKDDAKVYYNIENGLRPNGGTQFRNALRIALRAIEKRVAERKIVIMMTDGDLASSSMDWPLKDLQMHAKRHKIQVIVIDINCGNALRNQKYFDSVVYIRSGRELLDAMKKISRKRF